MSEATAENYEHTHSLAESSRRQRRRLRNALVVFLLCLCAPLVLLFHQGYSQLQRETFFQYRLSAEDLVTQVNQKVFRVVEAEENRAFDEYGFISIGEAPLQGRQNITYSPLSALPPQSDVPGVLGYFQINPDGSFQSPLLPDLTESELYYAVQPLGLNRAQLNDRLALKRKLEARVVGSSIFREHIQLAGQRGSKRGEKDKSDSASELLQSYDGRTQPVIHDFIVPGDSTAPDKGRYSAKGPQQQAVSPQELSKLNIGTAFYDLQSKAKSDVRPKKRRKKAQVRAPRSGQIAAVVVPEMEEAPLEERAAQKAATFFNLGVEQTQQRLNEPARSWSLNDDEAVQAEPMQQAQGFFQDQTFGEDRNRSAEAPGRSSAAPASPPRPQVLTFDASIDPFQFARLENGDFVFYRKVWQERRPYVQGFIVEAEPFLRSMVSSVYYESAIGQMSRLTVAFSGEVIKTFETKQSQRSRYLPSRSASQHSAKSMLLYRSFLPAPLDAFELLFSVEELPSNAGAPFLTGLAVSVGTVLILGLVGIYRLGVRQIRFAEERSNFVSAVSHELKTPLTSIRMYGEMLRSGYVEQDEKKRRTYYDFIFFESERLSRLIGNVLQLARIGNSRFELELSKLSPKALVDMARSKVVSQVESAGFELLVAYPEDWEESSGCVEAEEDSFAAIIINLVDNALKFSKDAERKEIELGFRLQTGGSAKVVFFVRDFGPGIERSQMKRIFQLFYRAQSEMTRTTPGTGIGLALVKELSAKMGAKVDVRNKEPGAEFQISMDCLKD